MTSLSQRARLVILLLYIAALFLASKAALGTWLPPVNEKGLWFYSGLAAILLGNLLVTPFFTKPADAISNAVAAIIALLAVNVWSVQQYSGFDHFLWLTITLYTVLVLLTGIFSIAFKDSPGPIRQKLSKTLYLFSDAVGTPKYVFSAVFLFALITFHRTNPREYLIIGFAWALFVALQPLEMIATLVRRSLGVWKTPNDVQPFGEIVGHEMPGIVLIRHDPEMNPAFGDLMVMSAEDGKAGLFIVLDHIGYSEGRWLRVLALPLSTEARRRLSEHFPHISLMRPAMVKTDTDLVNRDEIKQIVEKANKRLIALVASETDISQVQFEIVRPDINLSEGRLVEVSIGTSAVLYQIINGFTKEEILQQKNSRGFVRGQAKKIGQWNESKKRFEIAKWLPSPNAPVYLVDETTCSTSKDSIGHFPSTNYPIMVDVDQLVTHNTAILGILGAGKSFLALELVERMIAKGIKVICFDLTNQYATELKPYFDNTVEQKEIDELQAIGSSGKMRSEQNVEEGGSIQQFKKAISDKLQGFLDHNNADKLLKIFNPVKFEVWRQDSKPFNKVASMASLTPTEITRLITEAVLEVMQAHGMSDKAKCCLVFEEAHSLIPEWTSVASEGDKAATNGTAKAILQGRKYGLGCLVITQRTANVTKTVLNQCNTIFALRVFDATGVDFLKNYVGEDYAGVLSTLEDRHAVVFGRASSCKDPVLIHLNDRAEFLKVFRAVAA